MPEIEIQTFEELLEKFPDHYLFVLSSGASVLDGIKCDKVEIREGEAYSKIQSELVLHDPSNSRLAKKHNESLKESKMTQPKKANVKFVVTKKEKPVKKAERMPFKNETVIEFLEQKDFHGLEKYLIGLNEEENYAEWTKFSTEAKENHEVLHTYQTFLNQHLANILNAIKPSRVMGEGPRNIFAFWAPSFLAHYGLKFPVEAIPAMTVADMMDDYYNCLYVPKIREKRYTSDPLQAFRENVKNKLGNIESQINYHIRSFSDLNEFFTLWGISEVKAWWRGLEEEDLYDLKDDEGDFSLLYPQLVTKFGGGLVEDWVKEWGGTPEDIDPDGDGRAPMNGE